MKNHELGEKILTGLGGSENIPLYALRNPFARNSRRQEQGQYGPD